VEGLFLPRDLRREGKLIPAVGKQRGQLRKQYV
jgi:hypothetical protein